MIFFHTTSLFQHSECLAKILKITYTLFLHTWRMGMLASVVHLIMCIQNCRPAVTSPSTLQKQKEVSIKGKSA